MNDISDDKKSIVTAAFFYTRMYYHYSEYSIPLTPESNRPEDFFRSMIEPYGISLDEGVELFLYRNGERVSFEHSSDNVKSRVLRELFPRNREAYGLRFESQLNVLEGTESVIAKTIKEEFDKNPFSDSLEVVVYSLEKYRRHVSEHEGGHLIVYSCVGSEIRHANSNVLISPLNVLLESNDPVAGLISFFEENKDYIERQISSLREKYEKFVLNKPSFEEFLNYFGSNPL